jgi:DNA recombination protein RmuC
MDILHPGYLAALLTFFLALAGGLIVLLRSRRRAYERERLSEQAGTFQAQYIDACAELDALREELRFASEERASALATAARIPELETELRALRSEASQLARARAELETRMEGERKAAEEKIALLSELRANLASDFKALSGETLQNNNKAFLQLAGESFAQLRQSAQSDLELRHQGIRQLVQPLSESLKQVDGKLSALEKERVAAYSSLTEQVRNLALTQNKLKDETGKLVHALSKPVVRGRWGEIQLRRVVELAGMTPHCDFYEQRHAEGDSGRLRPDMVVQLPGGKNIVVDAKAPLEAYMEAADEPDEERRKQLLLRHAGHVRTHMKQLGQKSYWAQFSPAPEFVLMFLPGEAFFSAALSCQPGLIEDGVDSGVIVASPTTLIALLRAVHYGWQQETIARSAQEVKKLGKELYDRLRVFTGHMDAMGKRLDSTIKAYNQAVGSLESRVLGSARRLHDLGVADGEEIAELPPQDTAPREMRTNRLSSGSLDADES